MVILRTRNKITEFLMILAWASPFKLACISLSIQIQVREVNLPLIKRRMTMQ